MIRIFEKKTFAWWQIGILGLLIFIPIMLASPIPNEDTGGYLDFNIERPPLYCVFLWLFHNLGSFQLKAAHWVQGVINFFALLYAGAWFHHRLKLPILLIYSILSIPIFFFYLYFGILASVSAEAIAFPLFIITFILLVDSFCAFDFKKIVFLSITSNLLILTREQFYYLYFVFFILIAWYLWRHIQYRKILITIGIIVFSILFTAFLNRMYHYSMHHQFKDSSAVGELLIIQGLYLSDSSAIQYFNNPLEKKIFTEIMKNLESENLTKKSAPKMMKPFIVENLRAHYDVAHDRILAIAKANSPTETTPYFANHLFLDMSKILYTNAIKDNLRFYLWRVSYFVGNIWICLSVLVYLIAFACRTLIDRDYNFTTEQIAIAISVLLILANASFVPIFAHFEQRYCYYSYFLYFILAGLLGKNFFVASHVSQIRPSTIIIE